ncbi:MAG: hypothetical protein Q9183_007639, partial [Haloplaca sp. 2 TL-2023]
AGKNGPQQAGQWSIRESFIAVVVGNLPMLYTLFQRIQHYGQETLTKSSEKKSYQLGSFRTANSSRVGKKGKKFPHPLSMPNDTAMDSDERIVVESKQEQAMGSMAMANRGSANYSRTDVQGSNPGIRVQTELRVESVDGINNPGQQSNNNEYDIFRYPESRV